MREDDAASLLARTAVFGQLGDDTLRQLAAACNFRSLRKGQIIFQQGDLGDTLYVVAKGRVKVVTSSPEGDEMLLATLKPPDMFGELAVIDGGPRSASTEAVEPAQLLTIGRHRFFDLMAEHPRLVRAVLEGLATMLRRNLERASDLVFLDLPGRVAKALLDAQVARGEPCPEGTRLDLELTQGEFATLVGGSRATVNQILRSFQERGYLSVEGRVVVVKRPDLLRRRAGG
jgi:CRP/FNR family transcriptional regulator, cyclic AMP receptor protein